MKLRFLSVICVIMLVLTSIFVLPVAAETTSEVFTDEFTNLNLVSSYDGNWDIFANHSEINRSVAGRTSTDSANNIYYSFSDKYIATVTVTVAEYTGFFGVEQVPVSVRESGSSEWVSVTMTASAETDIAESTNASFKQIVLSANNLPENISEIKIGLTNGVAWTLFLDSVSFTFSEKSDLISFTDTLENLDKTALSSSNWSVYNPHSEIGLSVIGRTDNLSESYIYYTFEDKYIASLAIDAVVASGYYTTSEITAAVLISGSEEWQNLSLEFGEEIAIESSTNSVFKSVEVTASSIPDKAVTLRLGISNAIGWTLFFDNVLLNLSAKAEQPDYTYFTDELISLSKTSSYEGEWDIFNSHSESGLSVVGRNNTASENNLYYTVSDSYIRALTVKIVEYAGYVDPTTAINVAVRASNEDDWTELDMNFGAAEDIAGYETSNAKSMTLTADVIYPAITEVRINLSNDVAWTMLIDSVAFKLESPEVGIVGDMTGDGYINVIDIVKFKKNLANKVVMGTEFDLNGDAVVDTADLIVLRKYLIGVCELYSAEVLSMKREIVNLQALADDELVWIASTQLESGAIPVSQQTAEGDATINPYFADYAAMALLERPELYAANVLNYINWHYEHLNNDGTIYDYSVTGGQESNSSSYDSTDSYAATFLSLLRKYYDKTGETAIIIEHIDDIEKVISALYLTYDNGLTFARPDYSIKYVMDNCEVWLGLMDAVEIYNDVIVPANESYSEKADKLAGDAETMKSAIESQLWNSNGYYEVGLNGEDEVAFTFSWSEAYPSGMAQLFPIFTGVITPDSERAQSVYNTYISNFDITDITASSSYYSIAVRTAAVMGDRETVRKYMSEYSALIEQATFRYTPYTAHVVMAAEIIQQNLLEQIG